MTRPIRCSCTSHQCVWHGASWREHGEAASLLDARGREITHEDPRLGSIKGSYQNTLIHAKPVQGKRG